MSQPDFPAPDAGHKKFNSRLVVPALKLILNDSRIPGQNGDVGGQNACL